MGKTIEFLRKCYHEDIHKFELGRYDMLGKSFLLLGMFVLMIGVYSIYAFLGYMFLKNILEILLRNNPELFQQWIWIVYGLVLGIAVSVIFQAIPSTDKSIKYIYESLEHQFIYFSFFNLAIFIWYLIFLVIHFLGLI